ncbi:hypothetical protein IR083_10500 [Dysgonomonas sp. GY75]|uniref:hypothetical protein n=1 Tax=Dysgonomonas sp. GY75 TaxID=2780419 RepID=UPI001883C4C4|nr:hypothetical protein [Dysgonomonas sp. GY75]MBF0649250.1 hypothetical protein [Dysgonomonas sp. GY75]
MKRYEVKTRFVFGGIFRVNAENQEKARENVERHCGLVMGGNIHTTLDEKDVDWDFGIHPETEIVDVRQTGKKNSQLK